LAKLPPTAPAAAAGDDASDHVQARLIAYRELARLADVEPTPSHPAIIELLQRVVEEPVRSQLAPLCRDWVDWGKRDTDGVLLVGQIIPGGHGGHGERIELQGGDRLPIQITGELVLASDQDYVALGQIITGAETFHIHIIAAVAAP
jgi:hypothetical protein